MNFSNNNKCNHIIQKSINLFNFSNLKSEQLFLTSDRNSFNYDFSNHELNKTGFKNISNQKKKTSKNFIKKIDMTIPSNEKLKEEKLRSDFFMNYENSFANFCGINEKYFQKFTRKMIIFRLLIKWVILKLILVILFKILINFLIQRK